ncbi:hypothetical protein CmeUKMEL1_10120 [Cryptosporidium meleagridis]|uniref:Integral membrane protein n=1 Tax=Cryptosporidium meleagridis TaxID=93969 RepID=A0A2P4Z1N3_9CRYT|nr:hypothetical protein CmeUKMEL1_10120 [Cryptosporidium meleagridis]
MFMKNILLLFIYFMFFFESITDDFLVKKETSLIKIKNEIPKEVSLSGENSNSKGLSSGGGGSGDRGGKKPVLRSFSSLPMEDSKKSKCHNRSHNKDKHCHGRKKHHIIHQHVPGDSSGKNILRSVRALRMKDPDEPAQKPTDMQSDEPQHNPDDDESCDDEDNDDDDDDDEEICEDDEEEEKYQKEKEKEENEAKHDQVDSHRKRRKKRRAKKSEENSRSRNSGKRFLKKSVWSMQKY